MIVKQLECLPFMVISGLMIISIRYGVNCESVFPTQAEQVNLLTNVYELFEQLKRSANAEQTGLDESIRADMELIIKQARLITNTLEETMILRLTSRSNAVCAFDAKEKMENITEHTFKKLTSCAKKGSETLTANSLNLTNILESSIKTGQDFLDNLNRCSEKRGLAVIACYKKIIQNDVVPVKTLLSQAVDNHRDGLITSFAIKSEFNRCTEGTVDELMNQLDLALDEGLNCT